MIWQRGSVQSSDFDDNGQFEENKEYGEKFVKVSKNSNEMAKGPFERGDYEENCQYGN